MGLPRLCTHLPSPPGLLQLWPQQPPLGLPPGDSAGHPYDCFGTYSADQRSTPRQKTGPWEYPGSEGKPQFSPQCLNLLDLLTTHISKTLPGAPTLDPMHSNLPVSCPHFCGCQAQPAPVTSLLCCYLGLGHPYTASAYLGQKPSSSGSLNSIPEGPVSHAELHLCLALILSLDI